MIVSLGSLCRRCSPRRSAAAGALLAVAVLIAALAVFAVGGCGGGSSPDSTPTRFTMYAIGETTFSVRCLIRFNSDTPQNVAFVEYLPDYFSAPLAFRPSDGLLYAGGASVSTVDLKTAALTPRVRLSDFPEGGGLYSGISVVDADFDPVSDRLRLSGAVIERGLKNFFTLRADVSTGQTEQSTPVVYAPGDVNADAAIGSLSDLAYTNNVAGATATTLYGIDTARDVLVQVDSDGRTLRTIGPLGVETTLISYLAEGHGFDIVSVSGQNIAYAVLGTTEGPGLYTINLATGRATLVGRVGSDFAAPRGVGHYYGGLAIVPVGRGAR